VHHHVCSRNDPRAAYGRAAQRNHAPCPDTLDAGAPAIPSNADPPPGPRPRYAVDRPRRGTGKRALRGVITAPGRLYVAFRQPTIFARLAFSANEQTTGLFAQRVANWLVCPTDTRLPPEPTGFGRSPTSPTRRAAGYRARRHRPVEFVGELLAFVGESEKRLQRGWFDLQERLNTAKKQSHEFE